MAEKELTPEQIALKAKQAKLKAMGNAIKNLEKITKKEGIAYQFGNKPQVKIPRFSTGALPLDIVLGGGIPRGRIVELFGAESSGKTLISSKCIAQCQKNNGVCAFVDVEHSFDPEFAAKLGVNVDELFISQPDHMTEAFQVIDQFVDAGCDFIVLDSTAALVPKEEFEGEVMKTTIGLVARGMSQFLKRITPKLANNNCSIIFINQTRDNIGVMYGCVHADTLVNFVDGRSIPIKEVVGNKIQGEVWSYNENTKQLEPKPIIDWCYNGEVSEQKDYIHFETQSIALGAVHSNGKNGFTVTPNHLLLTQDGWKEAKDVTIEDKLISRYNSFINETFADFLYGTIIGDCSVKIRKKATGGITFQDNTNLAYVKWKVDKLSPFLKFKETNAKQGVRFNSAYHYELAKIHNEMNNYEGKRNPLVMLENHYSDLGLAIWYMDDGHLEKDRQNRANISIKRLKNDMSSVEKIISLFKEKVGIDITVYNNSMIYINSKDIDIFMQKICKYVPECMQYKLPEEYRNKYEDFVLTNRIQIQTDYVPITSICIASDRQLRQKGKYDLTILDNSNYMVGGVENGVIIHNSPETTPGGKALKFYSSIRIKVSRDKSNDVTEGDNIVQRGIKCNIVKNKTAIPYKTCSFGVFLDGREANKDLTTDIANIACDLGYIGRYKNDGTPSKSGRNWKASYTNLETNETDTLEVTGSREDVIEELKNHPVLKEYLLKVIKGEIDKPDTTLSQDDTEMTEEDFEKQLEEDINEAEEMEWNDITD